MNRSCSMHGSDEKITKDFGWKINMEDTTWKT
jgi:hypothetical protein